MWNALLIETYFVKDKSKRHAARMPQKPKTPVETGVVYLEINLIERQPKVSGSYYRIVCGMLSLYEQAPERNCFMLKPAAG